MKPRNPVSVSTSRFDNKIMQAYCVVLDFHLDVPTVKDGCFSGGNFAQYEPMISGRIYDVGKIKFMVKDLNDPYVTAYQIGENG